MSKIAQYIPLQLSFFLVLGVLLGFYFSFSLLHLFIVNFLLVVLLGFLYLLNRKNYQWSWAFQFVSFSLMLGIGISSISLQKPQNQKNHYSKVVSGEHRILFQISKQLKSTKYHNKYFVNILQIDGNKHKGKVLLNLSKESATQNPKIGDTYITFSEFSTINKPENPHTFNYKNYLLKKGVIHQLSLSQHSLKKVPNNNYNPYILAGKIRTKLQNALSKYPFQKNELGIINALVLGQRQNISKELLNSYAGAGAIHILAVSGLHVGILFMLLGFLLKPLEKIKYGKHFNTVCIILFLWGFALLTGLSGSVVRAVSMFTFIAIGMAIRKHRSAVLHALITSFFVLVLIHPRYIFDVGFQMSYAAVLGIILLFPKIQTVFPRIKWFLPRKIWELFVVSVSATIGTLPISLYYFHQFPSLFFLSNIVIVPFVGIIMGVGILVILLALLNLLPNFLVISYSFVLAAMNRFIEWVAQQEAFLLQHISFSIYTLLGSYLVISFGYIWLSKKSHKRFVPFLISILIFQAFLFMEKYQTETTGELVVFHKSSHSVIGIKQNKHLQLLHTLDSLKAQKLNFITSYKVENRIDELTHKHLTNSILQYKNTNILILDSLRIYKNLSFKPNIVLLRLTPSINLERLLKETETKLVVADGSNYKSAISRWRETCFKNKIAFHYTGKKGAFVLKK